jgi:hypothetical protein
VSSEVSRAAGISTPTSKAWPAAGFLGRCVVELHLARDGIELGVVRRDQPIGRDHAGIGRYDDGRDAEFLGNARGMQRPCAAERHEGIVARIAAALGRDELDRAHDVGVSELQCGGGRLLDAEAEALRQRLEGPLRRLTVEAHAAA